MTTDLDDISSSTSPENDDDVSVEDKDDDDHDDDNLNHKIQLKISNYRRLRQEIPTRGTHI